MGKLKDKYQAFAQEYIKHYSATKAALAVGYPKKNINSSASRLLANVNVQEFIAVEIRERSKRTGMDADRLLMSLVEMLEADIGDILKDDNTFKPIKEWAPVWRKMYIGSSTKLLYDGYGKDRENIGEIIKMKFLDRTKILEMIGKHVKVGAFEKEEVNFNFYGDMQTRILKGRDRLGAPSKALPLDVKNVTPEPVAHESLETKIESKVEA